MKTQKPIFVASSNRVGFTGTGKGMTLHQKDGVGTYLKFLKDAGVDTFHHGDCTGADSEAHDIAKAIGYNIVVHPPEDKKSRAFKAGGFVMPPEKYLDRNHTLVDASSILVAAPKEKTEKLRSGTWATIRYARKTGTPVKMIYPE